MYRMRKYRPLALGTALLLCIPLFGGCTTNEPPENPLPVQQHSLKILNIHPGDLSENPMAEALEKATGFQLEFSYLPPQNGNDKLRIEIASGTPYDLLRIDPQQFENLTLQGSLCDMTDLIYQYGSRILAVTEDSLWSSTSYRGHIYGVPQPKMEYVDSALIARKDILDRLNLPVPTTLEEFSRTLRRIKEETDLIPLSITAPFVDTIAGGFGIFNAHYTTVENDLSPMVKQPGMSAYLAYMNELYREQLLDQNWPFNRTETVIRQFTSEEAAVITVSCEDAEQVIPLLQSRLPEAEAVLLPPLTGDAGQGCIRVTGGLETVTCIPAASNSKVEATWLINELLKEEKFRYIVLGEEGVDYLCQDGEYAPIAPNFERDRSYSSGYLFGLDGDSYEKYWSECIVRRNAYLDEYYRAMQECPEEIKRQDPMSRAPVLPVRAVTLTRCDELLQDGYTELIVGIRPLSDYERLVEEYEQAGGKQMLEEANAWYHGR